jgi:multiple sugar transport system ATP-binding protein
MTLASRIAVMHKGELQQFAEPRQVYDRPANMFVAGFMGSPPMNFISARIANGEGTVIEIDQGGSKATLPLARPLTRSFDAIVLGVRPENIAFARENGVAKPGSASFKAVVELVEQTGAETIVGLRLAEREITARFSPDDAPRVGETIALAVDMTKSCLFDPKDERLIS